MAKVLQLVEDHLIQGFSIKMLLFTIDAQLLLPKVYSDRFRSVHALTKLLIFSLEMSPHKKLTKNWEYLWEFFEKQLLKNNRSNKSR